MKIGFFDSGIGGLTVLRDTIQQLPNEDYIYYADTDNVPYGIKNKDEIKEYILKSIDFIAEKGVNAVVIACNTATSVAIDILRKRYNFPVIGMEPAVKPAVERSRRMNKKALVFATSLTLSGEKFKNLVASLNGEQFIDYLPLSELVNFAQEFKFDDKEVTKYLVEKLSAYDLKNYCSVVLGCTHFILFKKIFKEIFPNHIEIIDGNAGTVNNLKNKLKTNNSFGQGSGNVTFYNSGREVKDQELLDKYYKIIKTI